MTVFKLSVILRLLSSVSASAVKRTSADTTAGRNVANTSASNFRLWKSKDKAHEPIYDSAGSLWTHVNTFADGDGRGQAHDRIGARALVLEEVHENLPELRVVRRDALVGHKLPEKPGDPALDDGIT